MKHDLPHLKDMLDYIDEIVTIAQQDRADIRTLRSVERDLGVIGEAANRLPAEVRVRYPDVPWRKIIDLRNIIVHGYDQISPVALWEIVDDHLPPLRKQIEQIIKNYSDD